MNPNMDSDLTESRRVSCDGRGERLEMGPTLLSQLAHVELTTPKFEESLKFWTEVVGLEQTARDGDTAYLRAWGDRFHHTLQLTEGPETGLGHIGWRAASPGAL